MLGKYWLSFVVVSVLSEGLVAQTSKYCNPSIKKGEQCNPYSTHFIIAKDITYQSDRQTLIVKKTLPLPPKEVTEPLSVEELIEKYVEVEEPIRYQTIEERYIPLHPEEGNNSFIIHQTPLVPSLPLASSDANNTSNTYGLYTIQKGDTLSTIAQKFQLTTEQLRRLNGLKRDAIIHVGKSLKIPHSQKYIDTLLSGIYIVESGDTLGSIAQKYNLTSKAIMKLNQLKKGKPIRIGQKLKLPFGKMAKMQKKRERLAKQKKKHYKTKRVKSFGKHRLRVTATAYSSHRGQTDSTPFLAAWNNRLRPGMKIIAVSRDLLTRYGMRNGTKVKISGLSGYYRVRDKMNKRYRKRIDIYMGVNRRRALRWGKRSVVIYW